MLNKIVFIDRVSFSTMGLGYALRSYFSDDVRDQRHEKQHKKQEKKNLCDARGSKRDSREAKKPRPPAPPERTSEPSQHLHLLRNLNFKNVITHA